MNMIMIVVLLCCYRHVYRWCYRMFSLHRLISRSLWWEVSLS